MFSWCIDSLIFYANDIVHTSGSPQDQLDALHDAYAKYREFMMSLGKAKVMIFDTTIQWFT